jgi:hypothetical protein
LITKKNVIFIYRTLGLSGGNRLENISDAIKDMTKAIELKATVPEYYYK